MDTEYLVLREKSWYKDSIGITQICGIFTEETDTNRTAYVTTLKYRFVDLRNLWAYEYKSFNENAELIRKFRSSDTAHFSGGWNFTGCTSLSVDEYQYISDTIIDAVRRMRRKISYTFDELRFDGIGAFRCDKKETYFQMDTALSNRVGCPLVYLRYYSRGIPHSGIDEKVEVISNNLPD